MHGIRVTKKRAVISIPALAMFLEEFKAGPMIRALIDSTELAIDSPDFTGDMYEWADEATDLLIMLFEEDNCVGEFPENCPPYRLDSERETLTIYYEASAEGKAKTRRARKPPPTLPIPLRLWRNPDSRN
ncbi:MAG TPA: hypothetical protein VIP11_23230 [Gemmatimonadaceae bacterium]